MKEKKIYEKPKCMMFFPDMGNFCNLVVNSNEDSGLPNMWVKEDLIDMDDTDDWTFGSQESEL